MDSHGPIQTIWNTADARADAMRRKSSSGSLHRQFYCPIVTHIIIFHIDGGWSIYSYAMSLHFECPKYKSVPKNLILNRICILCLLLINTRRYLLTLIMGLLSWDWSKKTTGTFHYYFVLLFHIRSNLWHFVLKINALKIPCFKQPCLSIEITWWCTISLLLRSRRVKIDPDKDK